MQLRDYLHYHKIKKKDFAEKIGFNVNYLGAVAEYVRKPSKRFALIVEIITEGKVSVSEIMDAEYLKRAPKTDGKAQKKIPKKTLDNQE